MLLDREWLKKTVEILNREGIMVIPYGSVASPEQMRELAAVQHELRQEKAERRMEAGRPRQ